MKVSEPAASYQSSTSLCTLRNKVLDLANKSTQIDTLQACLEILESEGIPCTYSDKEFLEELKLSEASGFVSNEDFLASCKEKWGVEL